MELLMKKIHFQSNDKNKTIMKEDISLYVLNARYLKECLNGNKNITNLKQRNGVFEFIYKKKITMVLHLLSKQELTQMPSWSKNKDTQAGMYSMCV